MSCIWNTTPLTADLNEKLNANEIQADSPDSIFQIIPKFSIDGDRTSITQLCSKLIRCKAASGDTGSDLCPLTALAIDKELKIIGKTYDGSGDARDVKNIEFSDSIDFVLWKRTIFLIGLNSSEIILLNPRTLERQDSQKLLTLPPNKTPTNFFIDSFIHSNLDPSKIDMYAIGATGDMYFFENVALSAGTMDSTFDINMSLDIDMASINGTRFNLFDQKDQHKKISAVISPNNKEFFFGQHDGLIQNPTILIDEAEGDEETFIPFSGFSTPINLIKALGLNPQNVFIKKLSRAEGLLFVLLSNGNLEIMFDDIFFITNRLSIPVNSPIIHDFTIVYANSGLKLWAIYSNSDMEHFIGIFGGGSFKRELNFKIPSEVRDDSISFQFPSQSSPHDEPFFLIESSNEGIKIYEMTETSIDVTIDKLLAKSLFDKAEDLAKKFGKDLDIVNKAKVRYLKNKILQPDGKKLKGNLFMSIKSVLELIKDAQFVCEFCTDFPFEDSAEMSISNVSELLSMGFKRSKECSNTVTKINSTNAWKKFFTFQQIHSQGTISQWNDFNTGPIFFHVKCLLEKEQYKFCEIVWNRHYDEFVDELNLADFGIFVFHLFVKRLGSPELVSLFQILLPFILDKICMEYEGNGIHASFKMLTYVYQQVRSLEREIRWPTEAVTFTQTLINVFETERTGRKQRRGTFGRKHGSSDSTLIEICSATIINLNSLLEALNELNELKLSYSICVPFVKYFQGDGEIVEIIDVVNDMLNELYLKEEVKKFTSKFLEPFAKRKNLELDTLYFSHIRAMVEKSTFFSDTMDIPYEERLIVLINLTKDVKVKLEAFKELATDWPVPWKPAIDELAFQLIQMSAPNEECRQLQREINLLKVEVPYRCITRKYKLNSRKLEKTLWFELGLLRILNARKETFYEDCLELIKHVGNGKYDALFIDKYRFKHELLKTDLPIEEILRPDYASIVLHKTMLADVLWEIGRHQNTSPQLLYQRIERLDSCAQILAEKLEDEETIAFLKLRKLVPALFDNDEMSSVHYPFNILAMMMKDCATKSIDAIIEECVKLSIISRHHLNDILILAASEISERNDPHTEIKVWKLVGKVASSEDGLMRHQLVKDAGLYIAKMLLFTTKSTSVENMACLEEFLLKLENSYDGITLHMIELFNIHRILTSFTEKEIPHRQDFLELYIKIYNKRSHNLDLNFQRIETIGQSFILFGEDHLLTTVFNTLKTLIQKTCYDNSSEMIDRIDELKFNLYQQKSHEEEEDENKKWILNELELCEMKLNSYALDKRDKLKLLGKLLAMQKYYLAAEIALTFSFTEQSIWEGVLNGLMNEGTTNELKKVLESLRHVNELWMIPEFEKAWLQASENDADFKNLCPIPLL